METPVSSVQTNWFDICEVFNLWWASGGFVASGIVAVFSALLFLGGANVGNVGVNLDAMLTSAVSHVKSIAWGIVKTMVQPINAANVLALTKRQTINPLTHKSEYVPLKTKQPGQIKTEINQMFHAKQKNPTNVQFVCCTLPIQNARTY